MSTAKPLNQVIQTIKLFNIVPIDFSEFIDLGKTIVYDEIIIENDTDQNITFKFENTTEDIEIIIEPNRELSLDRFKHWGLIQYKYTSVQPTMGNIVHYSW